VRWCRRVLGERHEPRCDEAQQGDDRGRLARAEAAEASDREGRDQADDPAERRADGEDAGREAPGRLVVARHDGAALLVGVRVAVVGGCGLDGSGGGAGLLDGDGRVDLRLTDGVRDGEGEDAGQEAREQAADQEVAWGHECCSRLRRRGRGVPA
jgi:hypothetical protein